MTLKRAFILTSLISFALVLPDPAAAQTSVAEQARLTEIGKRAVATWRKTNPGDTSGLGGWELKYGAEYLELGNFEDADVHFRRSLASNTGNAYTHYFRGLALAGLGRRDEAAREFGEARAIDRALGERGLEQMGPAPVTAKAPAAARPGQRSTPATPPAPATGGLAWSGRVFSGGKGKATTGTLRITPGTDNTITGEFHIEAPLAGNWSLRGTKSSTLCELRGATEDGRPVEVRGSCTEGRFEGSFDIRGERGDWGTLALEKGGRKESAPLTGTPAEQECIRQFGECYARANAGRGFDNNSLAGVNDCTFQKTQCLARARQKR